MKIRDVLDNLFKEDTQTKACNIVHENGTIIASQSFVYNSDVKDSEELGQTKYLNMPEYPRTDPKKVLVEAFMNADKVDVDQKVLLREDTMFLFYDSKILVIQPDESTRRPYVVGQYTTQDKEYEKIPIKLWSIRDLQHLIATRIANLTVSISVLKMSKNKRLVHVPNIRIALEGESLIATMRPYPFPEINKIVYKEKELTLTGWDDDKEAFEKVVDTTRCSKLAIPPKSVEDVIEQESQNGLAAPEVITGADQEIQEQDTTEVVSEPPEQEMTETPKVKSEESTRTRTRKPDVRWQDMNLQDSLEFLGSQLDLTDSTPDDCKKMMQTLRDLIIYATRQMVNINTYQTKKLTEQLSAPKDDSKERELQLLKEKLRKLSE